MKTDCTALIERMENFEGRAGVALQAVFAECEDIDGQLNIGVRGEAHASKGDSISNDIEIVANAYDAEGRLISTATSWMNSENFFGFDTFDLSLYDITTKPSRIRLFPKIT